MIEFSLKLTSLFCIHDCQSFHQINLPMYRLYYELDTLEINRNANQRMDKLKDVDKANMYPLKLLFFLVNEWKKWQRGCWEKKLKVGDWVKCKANVCWHISRWSRALCHSHIVNLGSFRRKLTFTESTVALSITSPARLSIICRLYAVSEANGPLSRDTTMHKTTLQPTLYMDEINPNHYMDTMFSVYGNTRGALLVLVDLRANACLIDKNFC